MSEAVTPLKRLPMTKALRDVLAAVTKKPWEIRSIPTTGELDPDGKPIRVQAPFGILYPLEPVLSGPPFHAPDADAEWTYQATYAAKRGDQAEWAFDAIVEAIAGRRADATFVHELTVPGMRVMNRWISDSAAPDPDSRSEIVQSIVRFKISVTPSG